MDWDTVLEMEKLKLPKLKSFVRNDGVNYERENVRAFFVPNNHGFLFKIISGWKANISSPYQLYKGEIGFHF